MDGFIEIPRRGTCIAEGLWFCHHYDQFDQFKDNIGPECSIIEYIELLQFWVGNRKSAVPPIFINKFGKQYIKLHTDDMDDFIIWLNDTRDRFKWDKLCL